MLFTALFTVSKDAPPTYKNKFKQIPSL